MCRLPGFVELVEKFLIIFQATLSGFSNSEKEQVALCLIPEVCELCTLYNVLYFKARTKQCKMKSAKRLS